MWKFKIKFEVLFIIIYYYLTVVLTILISVDDCIVIGDNCYVAVNDGFREGATWDQADFYCRNKTRGVLAAIQVEDEKLKVFKPSGFIILVGAKS